MKYATPRPLVDLSSFAAWGAALLLALSGCGTSASGSVDGAAADADGQSKPDLAVPSGAPDAAPDALSPGADARTPDVSPITADALAEDSLPEHVDAVADAAGTPTDARGQDSNSTGREDAGPEAASGGRDAAPADDARPPADATAPTDVAPRADAVVADSLDLDHDAESLPCQTATAPATLVHLTPLELKTILDGPDDPYLINVKGTSIPNIPGTDAVLASDVPGIESLVGGNLCADIILYCRSGNTSQTVGEQLIAKGYLRVRDLEGGITAWTAAGYPTE